VKKWCEKFKNRAQGKAFPEKKNKVAVKKRRWGGSQNWGGKEGGHFNFFGTSTGGGER